MGNLDLQKLAEALNLTDGEEQEPYILTPEEEKKAIDDAIEREQKFAAWKLRWLEDVDLITTQIRLTDWNSKIDHAKVLAQANMLKNRELWQRSQRQAEIAREVSRVKELQVYWTYRRIYKLMRYCSFHRFGKELDETNENMQAIKALCFFLARDDRFFTELKDDKANPYNPLKGLLIRGPAGTGKTHLVRCCEDNGLNPIATFSMIDITEVVKAEGKYEINTNGKPIVYLDDVGTEEASVKHYGTATQWFKNFIETVYLRAKCYNHLIITTNLNWQGISDAYGYRVESRMREMFNVIDLKGKDRRK